MRRSALVILCVLVLGASGCGSRTDSDSADGESELGGTETTAQDGQDGAPLGPDSAELGTIANPCSGEVAEGEAPADTPGVTDDTIRIGVISDKENPAVPLPTVGIEESVKAFVELCNAAGGIDGRTLELQTYDSEISRTEEVTNAACRDDLFALVGDGSVQDQQGVTTREECGLPEVAGYAATSTRAQSKDFFSPIPANDPMSMNAGFCQYIAEQFPDAVTKAAMVYSDLPAASVRGRQIIDGCEGAAGYEYVVERAQGIGDTNYNATVADMKAKGVKYLTAVSATSETLALLEEVQTQGLELEVLDLGQQYYDKALADSGLAEGAFVLTNTAPFSEAGDIPMLQLYLDSMAEVGAGDDKVTTLGVQSFSAGLLFATAADALGNDLTREALLTELEGITSWDGGGLHMETNPGERQITDCFLYLTVTDGEFVREHPDDGFDCDPDHLYTSDKTFES